MGTNLVVLSPLSLLEHRRLLESSENDLLRELLSQSALERLNVSIFSRTARLNEEGFHTATKEELRLANMHRVKGLEFRCMVIAGVSEDRIPLMIASLDDDETGKAEHEARERSLLFVSATRARDRLIVTCSGEPSRYLANPGVDSQ